MKNLGARSSIIVGLGAAALMLASIGCSSSSNGTDGGATGGSTGTGGSAAGGAGGGTKPAVVSFTFDTTNSTQGFNLQNYVDTSAYKNLGALAADAGVPTDGSYPTIGQADGFGQGSPATGALKVVANFTDYQQYVEVKVAESPPKDLTGTKLHAAINVTTSFYGGAFLYAKSGGMYVYASSIGSALTNGVFTSFVFDVGNATSATAGQTFDPTTIEELGVHIYSDGKPDGGTFASGPYTFYIDNVVAQ
jgi:hypothetical protein